jgi:hypothetical protein
MGSFLVRAGAVGLEVTLFRFATCLLLVTLLAIP